MKITEVTIRPATEHLVKGYADIVFDNCFMIEGIRIIQGPTGLFISFPAKKQRDGTHRDIAFPANAETRMHDLAGDIGGVRENRWRQRPRKTGLTRAESASLRLLGRPARRVIRTTFSPAQEFQSLSDRLQRCSSTTLELLKSRCPQSMRPWVVLLCTSVCLLNSHRRHLTFDTPVRISPELFSTPRWFGFRWLCAL
jgi:stage V sporulation protein G